MAIDPKAPSFWLHLFGVIVPGVVQALKLSGIPALLAAAQLLETAWALIKTILDAHTAHYAAFAANDAPAVA